MENSEVYFRLKFICHEQVLRRHKLPLREHKNGFFRNLTGYPNHLIMKTRRMLIHSFVWMFFIFYELSFLVFIGAIGSIRNAPWFYLVYIILFYFHSHLLLDRFSGSRLKIKWVLLVLSVAGELALFTIIALFIQATLSTLPFHKAWSAIGSYDIGALLWRVIYFMLLSTGYWLALHSVRIVKKNAALQNASLQSQIKPHMVFNALNAIYNDIAPYSYEAAQKVLLLSDIMRYEFREPEPDGKVPVQLELDQVDNYIKLYQLRYGDRLCLSADIVAVLSADLRVPPSLLLTFVENVFQHGQLRNPSYPARINIHCADGILRFRSFNLKVINDEQGSRTGMKNAKTRLNNFYPNGLHELYIDDSKHQYSLNLNVRL
jgi:two-component system LytT family sensor kinase